MCPTYQYAAIFFQILAIFNAHCGTRYSNVDGWKLTNFKYLWRYGRWMSEVVYELPRTSSTLTPIVKMPGPFCWRSKIWATVPAHSWMFTLATATLSELFGWGVPQTTFWNKHPPEQWIFLLRRDWSNLLKPLDHVWLLTAYCIVFSMSRGNALTSICTKNHQGSACQHRILCVLYAGNCKSIQIGLPCLGPKYVLVWTKM